MKMKEKMKTLENVLMYFNPIIDDIYGKSLFWAHVNYKIKEHNMELVASVDDYGVGFNLYDTNEPNKHFATIVIDNEEDLNKAISILSDICLCDYSLFEVWDVLSSTFLPKLKWDSIPDIDLTVNHKQGTRSITLEQIREAFMKTTSFTFQKEEMNNDLYSNSKQID